MGDKPTAAFVLALIGGIFVLIGGIFQAFIGAAISSFGGTSGATGAPELGSTVAILGILGLIFGIIMMLGGVMLYTMPTSQTMWGVIVIILSISSIACHSFVCCSVGFLLGQYDVL